MYNDHLSVEEARERVAQRTQEAETYSLHQRLGYRDHGTARWVFAFAVIVIAAVAIGLLL